MILACHLTGVYDVNRNNILQNDNFLLIENWAASVEKLQLSGIVFHNNFTEATCAAHQNDHVRLVKIDYDSPLNPNVYRYFVYKNFLNTYASQIKSVFVTDISDVTVVQNPFSAPLFLAQPDCLFCGDEPKTLDNEWMKNHSAHLRTKIADYADYEQQFGNQTLLNCGVFGGNISVMQPFIEQLWAIHEAHNYDNATAYTGDMGAFNYLARTQWGEKIRHGAPINTVFKALEEHRTDCWFLHK